MAIRTSAPAARSRSPNDVTRAPISSTSAAKPRGVRSLREHLSSMTLSPNSSRSLDCESTISGFPSPSRSIDSFSTTSLYTSSSNASSSSSRRRLAAAAAAAHAASTSLGTDITNVLLKQEKRTYSMEHFGDAITGDDMFAQGRPAMVQWMTSVVSTFGFSYDSVLYSAMYYLDAALASDRFDELIESPAQLQLLALTALNLAIKIHSHVRLPIKNLLAMAHVDSAISADDVVEMEQILLPALSWHLHPPTPGAFIEQYCDELDLRYKCVTSATRRAIRSMAMHTLLPILIASHGEDGVYAPASVQAYSALWIAIESCSYPTSAGASNPRGSNLSPRQAHRLSKAVARAGGNLNCRSAVVQDACCRLSAGLERQQQQQHAQQMQMQQMQQQLMQQQQQQQQHYMFGASAPPAPGYGYHSYYTPPKPIAAKKPSPSPATVCADPYFQQYQQQQNQFQQMRSSRSPCGEASIPR